MSLQSKGGFTVTAHNVSIERWTVERLDHDAGLARVETVPMKTEYVTQAFLDHLVQEGLAGEMEDLSLWEVNSLRMLRLPIRRLLGTLGMRPEEAETLSENMVFWMIVPGRGKTPVSIYHATGLARKVSNDLYDRVRNGKGGVS